MSLKEIDTHNLSAGSKVIVCQIGGFEVDEIDNIEIICRNRFIHMKKGDSAYDHQVYAWSEEREKQILAMFNGTKH